MRSMVLLVGLVACAPTVDPASTGFTAAPTTEPVSPTTLSSTPVPADRPRLQAVNDRDFADAALEAIADAEDHVRVAEFLLFDTWPVSEVLDALGAAATRGVTVRVLADEEGSQTQAVLDALAAHGVDTRLDSPRRTLHTKLIVADDVVLVGSHNFTDDAFEENHEGTVRIDDDEVAAWYGAWFDAVWEAPEDDPALTPLAGDVVPVADRDITDALIACLDGAQERVEVLLYAVAWNADFPDSAVDRVLTAVEAAHGRGVGVRVVLDGSSWSVDNGINDDAIARLGAAGVPMWRTPRHRTTHAKVTVCDDTTVVSDANWSYSGLELMHGTSAVVHDAALAAVYAGWIDDIVALEGAPATTRAHLGDATSHTTGR